MIANTDGADGTDMTLEERWNIRNEDAQSEQYKHVNLQKWNEKSQPMGWLFLVNMTNSTQNRLIQLTDLTVRID